MSTPHNGSHFSPDIFRISLDDLMSLVVRSGCYLLVRCGDDGDQSGQNVFHADVAPVARKMFKIQLKLNVNIQAV